MSAATEFAIWAIAPSPPIITLPEKVPVVPLKPPVSVPPAKGNLVANAVVRVLL